MSIVRKLLGLSSNEEQKARLASAKEPDRQSVAIANASQSVQVSADRARQVMAELLAKQSFGTKQ